MKNCSIILTEKLQKYLHYHLKKIDRYEYLTDDEILPPGQSRVIEQAKYSYFLLGKAFEKKIITI